MIRTVYVLMEKADARGGESILNYDVMRICEDADEANKWLRENIDNRCIKPMLEVI